jgi:DNA repair exonuclease SbcCD nuclease subunit
MKIAYFTDPHISDSGSNSSWIGGDYLAFSLANLNYIYSTAKAEGCDSVVCSGDFFHERNQQQFVVREVISELQKHDITTIIVPGQHDTSNHSSEDYVMHSLGVVEAALGSKFQVVHSGQHVIRSKYLVYGFGFSDDETTELIEGTATFPLEQYPNLQHIAIVHASVGEVGWGGLEAKDVVATGFDWVLLGDIHPGFEPHQEVDNGPIVYGVGSATKRSLNESGLVTKFAIIDLDNYDITVMPIPMPPEDALLRRSEITVGEEVKVKVAEFVSMFNTIANMEGMSAAQIVNEIAKSNCIDDKVRDSFLRKL